MISGIGSMVGRAIQITIIPQLTLGPGDRSPRRRLGSAVGGRCWLGGSLVPDGVG